LRLGFFEWARATRALAFADCLDRPHAFLGADRFDEVGGEARL
jgi:hypothetical protein